MLNKISSIFLYTAIGTMLLVVLPGFPPYMSFKSFKLTPAKEINVVPNFSLDKAMAIDGEIIGAESSVVQGDIIFTGTEAGDILKVEDSKGGARISTVSRMGEPCDTEKCGRPLGMRMDAKGKLFIIYPYEGIVQVNPKTGSRQLYCSVKEPIEGVVSKVPNDLDVSKDGTIYWSDFSSVYDADEFKLNIMGDNSGRLVKYDPNTKKNTVLLSGLFGANGVQLSEKEDYVLVSEFTKARILRYNLKGSKAGTFEVFLDGLPGHPDNIRSNGKGGYFIALVWKRTPAVENLGPLPQLRKLLFRLQWFLLTGLSIVERTFMLFDSHRISAVKAYVENFGTMGFDLNSASVLEVDGNGNTLAWYKSKRNEMLSITQATLGKSYVYLNSIHDDKLWKISLKELRGKA